MKVKFDATDEEINNIRKELIKWETKELIPELLRLEGDLNNKTSDEEVKKYRIGFLTLALIREESSKRGVKTYSTNR